MPCLIALAALAASGCRVYDPSLVDVGGQCVGRAPPPRQSGEDPSGGEEHWFGLRDVVLRQGGGAWQQFGYNLDGFCTRGPDYGRECNPALESERPLVDGEGGVDNAFGAELFPIVEATVPGLEEASRRAQLLGAGSPIVRLQGWNGTDDDPLVHATVTQSVFTTRGNPDGSAPTLTIRDFRGVLPDDSPAPDPVWDGNDYTWVRSDTFLDGDLDAPFVYDDTAYVAGGVLVLRLPNRVDILFPADRVGVLVRLTAGLATARISADRQRLEDVIVAGRWKLIDLLDTADNIGVCRGTPEHRVLEATLRAILDVRSEPEPGTVPECDAISLGVGFTGYALNVGGVTPGPPLQSACAMRDGGLPDGGPDGG